MIYCVLCNSHCCAACCKNQQKGEAVIIQRPPPHVFHGYNLLWIWLRDTEMGLQPPWAAGLANDLCAATFHLVLKTAPSPPTPKKLKIYIWILWSFAQIRNVTCVRRVIALFAQKGFSRVFPSVGGILDLPKSMVKLPLVLERAAFHLFHFKCIRD